MTRHFRSIYHFTTSAKEATVFTLALALSVAVLLALSGAVAQAEVPKLISYGTFGPTEGGMGVAVDQSNGDVYTAGLIKFAANREPAGGGRIQKFGVSGGLLATLGEEGFRSGAAVNPTNGDLYVLNTSGSIETYDPATGKLVSSFEVAPSGNFFGGFFTVVQIASDAEGNVYVPVVPENEVLEYTPTGALLNTFKGSGAGALKEPTGVAVDSSGNLWVADAGNNRIEELSSTGTPLGEIKSDGVHYVARDGRGDVFALVENKADYCGSVTPPCVHLVEYGSTGAQLADVGAGDFTGVPGEQFNMLAVDEASGRVYVTEGISGSVWIFGPPTAPVVGRELTAEVSTSVVKLGALVDPGGLAASYRFEYLTEIAFQANGNGFSGPEHAISVPFPEGSAGEGISSRTVWAAASGLAPGTTYHYRVVASSELGTVHGPDQTFTTLAAEQAACPNEQFRGGFSSRLPDCRAYELVTVPTKTSAQVQTLGSSRMMAAADGGAVSFTTRQPFPGSLSGGSAYVATRSASAWRSQSVFPLESYSGVDCGESATKVLAYSDELSRVLFSDDHSAAVTEQREQEEDPSIVVGNEACNAGGAQVVSGEPEGYLNLLLRENATGAYGLVDAPPPAVTPSDAHFQGASADLSHVVFSELAHLTENALGGVENLYEWDEGALSVVSVLPDGTPVAGSLAAPSYVPAHQQVISADGSHILFTYGGGLYDRVDGERTVQIDESEGSGASGGGVFQAATSDGSEVFFTDERRLTRGSTAAAGEPDLYECVLSEGASKCEPRDLTIAQAGEHADVARVWPLGGKESSDVYFLAGGVLASNTREYLDTEGKPVVEGAQRGQQNLYLWNGNNITFIATFTGTEFAGGDNTTIAPDGQSFAFNSAKSLTGYDNGPFEEVFLYSAASNQLVCASCNPSGEAPVAGARINPGGSSVWERYLSDGGRLFFETQESLVPSDTNGQTDVYEYEDGHLYLLSGGTSSSESSFIDASENGDDVFFLSSQALVPPDKQEGALVIYDARVDGGFPEPASPPPCTTADACRAPVSPQPSLYGAPSSQTFSGAGNVAPASEAKPKAKPRAKPVKCKRGLVKQKGRCVKRSGRKPKRKAKQSAHTNRKGK